MVSIKSGLTFERIDRYTFTFNDTVISVSSLACECVGWILVQGVKKLYSDYDSLIASNESTATEKTLLCYLARFYTPFYQYISKVGINSQSRQSVSCFHNHQVTDS